MLTYTAGLYEIITCTSIKHEKQHLIFPIKTGIIYEENKIDAIERTLTTRYLAFDIQ